MRKEHCGIGASSEAPLVPAICRLDVWLLVMAVPASKAARARIVTFNTRMANLRGDALRVAHYAQSWRYRCVHPLFTQQAHTIDLVYGFVTDVDLFPLRSISIGIESIHASSSIKSHKSFIFSSRRVSHLLMDFCDC